VTGVKAWLRDGGAARLFDLRAVKEAELAVQRLHFAPRLLRAAGYAGWCLFLDEVELIGRYAPLQRARSYAELARWLGLDQSRMIPGLVTVAAVTDDFAAEMFGRKRDAELLPSRLEERGLQHQAALARRGIEWLERRQSPLLPPAEAGLRRSLNTVAGCYRKVYGWAPSRLDIGGRLAGKSMRQYVKSWITTWDIERLYGQTPQIAAETIATDYSERGEINQVPPEAGESDDIG
jgi:P-loop Domain of unknown function (DUF2791)